MRVHSDLSGAHQLDPSGNGRGRERRRSRHRADNRGHLSIDSVLPITRRCSRCPMAKPRRDAGASVDAGVFLDCSSPAVTTVWLPSLRAWQAGRSRSRRGDQGASKQRASFGRLGRSDEVTLSPTRLAMLYTRLRSGIVDPLQERETPSTSIPSARHTRRAERRSAVSSASRSSGSVSTRA